MKLKTITTSVRRIERHLSPADDWASKLREAAYKSAQSVLNTSRSVFGSDFLRNHDLTPLIGIQFTREKGFADYICTVEADVDAVETALWHAGYQRNMLSTWKYRVVNNRRQDITSAWVYDPANTETQHDVYLFDNGKTVDVYGHKEPSVRNPVEHLDLSTGTNGDPDNRAKAALAEAGIKTTTTYTKQ
jgi:hypothetical protein